MIHFGEFSLDIRAHTLTRAGQPVPLRPKAFETLVLLIQQRDRLVTREELLGSIWPGLVVTDGTLTHCIEEVRRAVGDDPHAPRVIQTIPRLGYRFIAQVREEVPDPAAAGRGEVVPATGLPRLLRSRRFLLSGATALFLVAVGAVLIVVRPDREYTVIRSLAVLPFENLGKEPGEDYLADGLTDALISEIAGISKLRVISRTSALYYRGVHKPLGTIAEELQVDAVVEGSVFRTGGRIRISAALIVPRGERRLWGESYELDERDLLSQVRIIARTLAREIPVDLTQAEQERMDTPGHVDPDVYELFLKGRYFWNRRSAEGFRRGIECYEQALVRDPSYAPAYLGLAESYNMLGDYDLQTPAESFPRARKAALQALAIDGSLAEAHASLAFSSMRYDWNWPDVEQEFGLALASGPNSSTTHHWYGLYLAMRGRFKEAKAELLTAKALDPLSLIITTNLAWVHYYAREYDEAIALCREALDLDSTFASARIKLGWAYEQTGRYAEARAQFLRALETRPSDPALQLFVAHTLVVQGARKGALETVRNSTNSANGLYVPAYHVAAVYSALGETDAALQWLERARRERSGWFPWIGVEPKFDALRDHPRFAAMVDSLHLH